MDISGGDTNSYTLTGVMRGETYEVSIVDTSEHFFSDNVKWDTIAVVCSARVTIHSVPLVPRNTSLFSLRYLRSGLSSSNLKFARFLHCACSVSTPGSLAPIFDNRPRPLRACVVDCQIGASRNPFSFEKVSRLPGV